MWDRITHKALASEDHATVHMRRRPAGTGGPSIAHGRAAAGNQYAVCNWRGHEGAHEADGAGLHSMDDVMRRVGGCR